MNMKPTGNGRRESHAHVPMPRMTNTYMLAGKHDPQEIIASVNNGLYAVSFCTWSESKITRPSSGVGYLRTATRSPLSPPQSSFVRWCGESHAADRLYILNQPLKAWIGVRVGLAQPQRVARVMPAVGEHDQLVACHRGKSFLCH